MTAQTLASDLTAIADKFHAAATAAAAALGLDATPDVTDILHATSDALGTAASLGASMTVAGPVSGDLVLLTVPALDAVLDDRAMGGLTPLSPRMRALRAAADVLGTRHGDAVELDPTALHADIAAVLSIGGAPVGMVALRLPRAAEPIAADYADIDVTDHNLADVPVPPAAPTLSTEPMPETMPHAAAQPVMQAPPAGADPGFRSFVPGSVGGGHGPVVTRLDQLTHVEMEVTVEIGRTRMTVGALLGLAPGQVVELDRAAGSPVDLFVNGTLLARGEVVVVDEDYGFRVTEIVSSREG